MSNGTGTSRSAGPVAEAPVVSQVQGPEGCRAPGVRARLFASGQFVSSLSPVVHLTTQDQDRHEKGRHSRPCSHFRLAGAHSGSRLVDHDKRSRGQIRFVLVQCRRHNRRHVIGENILTTDLDDTRADSARQSEYRSEIQVVCEHNVAVGSSPVHDLPIRGPRIADGRPVDRRPTAPRQLVNPIGGQVHIDQSLEAHGLPSGTSRSSTRQAA